MQDHDLAVVSPLLLSPTMGPVPVRCWTVCVRPSSGSLTISLWRIIISCFSSIACLSSVHKLVGTEQSGGDHRLIDGETRGDGPLHSTQQHPGDLRWPPSALCPCLHALASTCGGKTRVVLWEVSVG